MDNSPEKPITTQEAEQVVEERIEQFGLGALPEVKVAALPDGSWRVHWDEFERIVPAMGAQAWQRWLHEHVGPLEAEALQTTES